jgi:hypothetical protein
MTTQQDLVENLYGLLEEYAEGHGVVLSQRIINLIPLIDDLNRWNIIIRDYEKYDLDIGIFIVDVNNPIRTYTTGNRPLPIDYGDSMLTFFIWSIKNYLDSDMHPMADEIVKMLILNGAKSSPYLYNSWLELKDFYQDNDDGTDENYEETSDMYDNIKNYLGLFNTINKLKNVRKKNRKAKTIQRRLRGNRSRLYHSDNPTKYMRNVPGLRKGVANKIDEGLREDEIESPDREIFKTEHFDPKWMSDREIEGNRLMADYVDTLDQYGGNSYRNKYERCKKMSESQQRAIDRITRLYEEKLFEDMDRMDEQESMENNAMADYIDNINQSGGIFEDLPIEIIDKELKKMNCKDRLSYCQTNRKSRDHCNLEPTLSEYIKPCRKKSKMNKTKRKTIEVSKRLQKKNFLESQQRDIQLREAREERELLERLRQPREI